VSVEEQTEESLLVSKSFYVQSGDKNKKEAIRISKVLKEFRWKVEPVYTIGVIVDDIISIETSKSEITRDLIARVEAAGFVLTAVVVDQGKPVAWFKRASEEHHHPEPKAAPVKQLKRGGPATQESAPEEDNEAVSERAEGDPATQAPPELTGVIDLTQPPADGSRP
jgi:hypothetical protein